MSILVTDGERGLSLYDRAMGRSVRLDCECPCWPCAARGLLLCACQNCRDVVGFARGSLQKTLRCPGLPALCALRASPCGRYLYQMSSEADCVHTRLMATGDLQYGRKTGVFPRGMRLHSSGRWLIAAGGASGEAELLRAPSLRLEKRFAAPGAVCAADFWQDGLALLCAVENGDLQTQLLTVSSSSGQMEELLRLEGQPGDLCTCPDGVTAIFSTLGGVAKVALRTGRLLWNLPQHPLCGRIECLGEWALLSDGLSGGAALCPHNQPWLTRIADSSPGAQACFC
ncbi:MAG: hypothetical protein PHY12_08400 [Eubacteriales bacterium]|nr:hypothetical protein [Eubacteriales bacterium]